MYKIFIITNSFVDYYTGDLRIGGLETYLKDLSVLFKDQNYEVCIYQLMTCDQNKSFCFNGINVFIINCPYNKLQPKFNTIYKSNNSTSSLFIIATDQLSIKAHYKNVITIQHGIGFDMPGDMVLGFWRKTRFLQHISKLLRCIKNLNRFYLCYNTVCVDYNYYNWLRTLGTIYPEKKIKVIPNYSSSCITKKDLENKLATDKKQIKIVFARRFVDYRGSILFAKVVKRILDNYNNVSVTFAGDGPCKKQLLNLFGKENRVSFTSFTASESISFHKNFDIAVIPTIFSEGTSLSLCESMAAGCFPICTHVGGMTNIIIDHFNGLMCLPSEDDLYDTLVSAIDMDSSAFNNIIRTAYDTATSAFNLELWKKKWLLFAEEVMNAY